MELFLLAQYSGLDQQLPSGMMEGLTDKGPLLVCLPQKVVYKVIFLRSWPGTARTPRDRCSYTRTAELDSVWINFLLDTIFLWNCPL